MAIFRHLFAFMQKKVVSLRAKEKEIRKIKKTQKK